MFNPYKHLRLAGALTMLIGMFMAGDTGFTGLKITLLGFAFVAIGVVGGIDLTERRVELLEKILLKEKDDAKTETP